MIKPPKLNLGDTIGVVAPAGLFDPQLFKKGVVALQALGYQVHLPEGLTSKDRFLAGPDQHRAGLINLMFADPEIKGILCARGGYGSLRILDLIDYDIIRRNPKIFIGFSDVSALLWVMANQCGLTVFHGPVMTMLGMENMETAAGLQTALTCTTPLEFPAANGEVLRDGTCQGPVHGGNLATLCHLVGTPYAPAFRDSIVVLEDVGEAPYKIDRMLCQMRMTGCFDGMAGLALGTFSDCGDHEDVLGVIRDVFKDMGIPILAGFNIGHASINLTFPIGVPAVLDTEKQTLSYTEAALL